MKKYVKCHIEDDNGNILLLKRAESDEHSNMWETPGGGIELNEEPCQAVIREVKEETGLDVTALLQENLILTDDSDQSKKFDAFMFKAITINGNVSLCPSEHSSFAWVHKDNLHEFISKGNNIDKWTLTHFMIS